MTTLQNDINNNIFNISDNDINNNRADISRRNGYIYVNGEYDENRVSEEVSNDTNNLPVLIYRFKFTDDFMMELYKFSKIHQYDGRKDFKDAWTIWIEENNDIVEKEMFRLLRLGYEGDVLNKMFKSARYYFRKKSSEKKEPKKRRQYVNVNRELLEKMDLHIESNIYDENYKPKTGFISFCKDNENILKDTISKMYEQNIIDAQIIQDKIKKTYKNRYFMLTKKN